MGDHRYTRDEAAALARRAIEQDRRRRIVNPECVHREPQQHRVTETLLSAPDVFAQFKVVPEDFYAREGGTAVIECPCGWHEPGDESLRQARIGMGELYECPGCLRTYYMGTRLHAANGAGLPGIEHSHPIEEPCLPPCPEYA